MNGDCVSGPNTVLQPAKAKETFFLFGEAVPSQGSSGPEKG